MLAKALAAVAAPAARARRPASSPASRRADTGPRPVIHPRLKVGSARDEAEKQADRIADRVLGSPSRAGPAGADRTSSAAVRRAIAPQPVAAPPDQVEDRDRTSTEEEQWLPETLEARLLALQRGGEPLPDEVRRDLEPRFGMDLSAVRIHTDGEAAQLSETVQAHAFTLGEHIAFNQGRFQPEQPAGRKLLAHELAHVAQHRASADALERQPVRRGFWGDLYDSVADTLGDIADWAWDKVQEFGWRLVRSISPDLERTLRAIMDEGILAWLGRQVARAWDGFLGGLRALVPFDGPRQLIDLFAGMVERAAAIVGALASGNCEPLMAAIESLKTFVVETVGVAWDRLTEFLRPIGTFFADLWASFGAPAVRWLQDFAGDVWEGIQALGRRFWEWIRPVREAAARVWNWFKDLLFGSSEGEGSGSSEGGVLGWISRKAGEAWDWVKERTRPVWQPVAEFAGKVAELIPPAFVRELGESAQQLSTELDAAGDGMAGGEGVPENRDTLASVLPSVENIIAAVRRVIVGAGQWLSGKIGSLAEGVNSLIGRLNANALVSWLASALGWLADLVNSLVDWARDKVERLFDWLVQGFDSLTPFLQMVLQTIRKLISIAADLLQLPLLILNALWQRVPACIREPIEDFIKNQVLARIPVFGQFFSDPELWPRVQQTALRILRRIFVDGDIAGAAWLFFQSVLRILGLPPELVVQVLAKAAAAIGDILTNPIGFLVNLLRAMRAGFTGFFGNIGTHLLNGFTGWLFGAVREAGINPPADLSLRSVLGFVLEVLGVTADNIFRRLGERVGPTVVARLRQMLDMASGVWSFVATLVNEGPAGLWRELSERLSSLWNSVVEGVVGFITERVIGWASRWLLSLLDVTGIMPVVNAVIALYRAIESFLAYLRELLEIVSRVLDGVLGIARGAIEQAAGFLENALASALPVAIGFLANQAGLGRLSARLREILGGLRARVDGAIDWLIDRALRLGRALIDMARRGVAAVGRGVARVREWWRTRVGFRGRDGRDHNLYFRGEGAAAELIIESEPQGFQTFLRGLPDSPDRQEAQRLYTELRAVQRTAGRPPAPTGGGTSAASEPSPEQRIQDLTNRLATVAARLMVSGATTPQATPPRYGSLRDGFGTSVEVQRLTSQIPPGSEPSVEGGLWNALRQRRRGNSTYYIRGHLLNHHVGGPGHTWANLTPLTGRTNTLMSSRFEERVKSQVDSGKVLYFNVQAAPAAAPDRSAEIAALRDPENPNTEDRTVASVIDAERAVPARVTGIAREVPADTPPETPASSAWREVARLDQENQPERSLDDYSVSDRERTRVSLSDSPRSLIRQLPGIDDDLADRIAARQSAGVVFRTRTQFVQQTQAPASLFDAFTASSRFIVRLYTRG